MKAFVAMLAVLVGVSFSAVSLVRADEKASAPAPAAGGAAPADKQMGGETAGDKMAGDKTTGDKKDMAGDKKAKKADKKKK
jgi:hypothetical protein